MSSKFSPLKKKENEVDILRVVPDENAFYFYKAIGTPLGIRANSLAEFSKKLKEIDAVSIRFHSDRHDFENWIKMLGDLVLAEQISSMTKQTLTAEKLRNDLARILEERLIRHGLV